MHDHTCQKPLTPALVQSRGGAVAYVGTLSDMDVAPEPTGRTCGVSRHKLLHGLGFPNDQWFSTCEPGSKPPHSLGFPTDQWFSTCESSGNLPYGLSFPTEKL